MLLDQVRLSKRSWHLLSLILIIFLSISCSSNNNVKDEQKFKVVASCVAKNVKEMGTKYIPIYSGDVFSTEDNAIYAYTKFVNLYGKHKLKWEWYDPSRDLYFSTKESIIEINKKKHSEETSVWDKILIKNEKAQDLPGKWRVILYFDNVIISSIDFKIIDETKFIVDEDIPITEMRNPDSIAVVIGNKYYNSYEVPMVTYARKDAESVKNYLMATLGYKEENIFFEIDATKARFNEFFGVAGEHRGLLFDYIKPNKSDVFVYYSGHGAPDTRTNRCYLLPSDCNLSRIALSGYSLDLLYENLSKLKTRKTIVVIDACFSGVTNSGKWLFSEASPALIKVKNPIVTSNSMVVFTSSQANQISSWYSEKEHGLFTYFFLKAICGAADTDKNQKLTFNEIYNYVSDQSEGVPYWAKRLHKGRIQEPTIQGLKINDVLVKY